MNIKYDDSMWRCSNTVYLKEFINRNYEGINLHAPVEVIWISDDTSVYQFHSDDKVIKIYGVNTVSGVEFFDYKTWQLHKITKDFKKTEFKNFIIYSNKEVNDENLDYAEFIERYIDYLGSIFGRKKGIKININIFSAEDFFKVLNTYDIDGFFDPLKGKIYTNIIDYGLTHEIVHSILNEFDMWPNIFCQEGVAEAFKKPLQVPLELMKSIQNFSNLYFDWYNLTGEKYGMGGLFFRFIFQRYGFGRIKNICMQTQGADLLKTEEIISKILKNGYFIKDFRKWFLDKNWDEENWFFPDGRFA